MFVAIKSVVVKTWCKTTYL